MGRDVTLDIAKGIAIVAIVVGHVGRGLVEAGILDPTSYSQTDRALYLVHLTVFIFVAGALTPEGVQRHGAKDFLRARVSLFCYLYVVWSVIQGVIRVLLGRFTNTVIDLPDVFQLWLPRGQMWFLPFIAAGTILLLVGRPWSGIGRWSLVVTLVATLLLWGREGSLIFSQGWSLIFALFLGAAVGRSKLTSVVRSAKTWQLASVAVAGTSIFYLLLLLPAAPPTYASESWSLTAAVLGLVASLVGVVVILAVSALVRDGASALGRTLALFGRHSLAIYLVHILAASGMRIVLTQLHVTDSLLHLTAGVMVGVLGPVFVAVVAAKIGLGWLFRAGGSAKTSETPALRTPGGDR